MAAGPWVIYNEAKVSLGAKVFALASDTFKVALLTSSSNAGSASLVTAQYATLTNELTTANGYTATGMTPGSPTWVNSSGTIHFDTADASWTASGGSIVARFAVIYDNTATNKDLIAYMLLDSTPADVTTTTGNTLTIQIADVFTLASTVMAQTYVAYNGAEPTTASRVAVATGTSIKTLLQIASPSTAEIKVIEWGISFDGSAAATPGVIELIQTDVAATSGTSLTPTLYGNPNGPASLCVGGTGATCFSPSAEGTIATVRSGDAQFIAPTNQYVKQFPLGREFMVPISKFLRIRVKFGTTVNAIAYLVWEE